MIVRSLAGGVAAAVLVALLPVPVAHAELYQCQGQPATILGGANGFVDGTPGDDVIVVPRAFLVVVYAGAGEDLVCVVDGPEVQVPLTDAAFENGIFLEEGDDVMVNESSYVGAPISIDPGAGADVVIGGPEDEYMDSLTDKDTETDRYSMGAGDDVVVSGFERLANSDDVDLGPGNDRLDFAGPLGPGGRIEGGIGSDYLSRGWHAETTATQLGSGSIVVDNRLGTATVDGAPDLAWAGIERFSLSSDERAIIFLGGDQDEELSVSDTVVVTADLGGGDDRLNWRHTEGPFRDGSTFEGGAGQDQVEAEGLSVWLDLRRSLTVRAVSYPDVKHVRRASVSGFEDASITATFSAWIRGTSAAQRLEAFALRKIDVRGFGGDDVITLRGVGGAKTGAPKRRAWGGAGNDRLEGTDAADLLVGGPGHDVANGKAGADRCEAEILHRCEARPAH